MSEPVNPYLLELELLRDFHRTWTQMHASAKERPDVAKRKAMRLTTLTHDLIELRMSLTPGVKALAPRALQ